jgi:hypothetical protein
MFSKIATSATGHRGKECNFITVIQFTIIGNHLLVNGANHVVLRQNVTPRLAVLSTQLFL